MPNSFKRALDRLPKPNRWIETQGPSIPTPADLLTPSEADLLALPIATGTLRINGSAVA
jgi:hypothetical protein